jgi:hypothetical protein
LIVSGDGGYALAVPPAAVDALAVVGQTVTASELLDAGDDRGAADLCERPCGCSRGPAAPLVMVSGSSRTGAGSKRRG